MSHLHLLTVQLLVLLTPQIETDFLFLAFIVMSFCAFFVIYDTFFFIHSKFLLVRHGFPNK